MTRPDEVLSAGVESAARFLQADGTLHDEVFDCPTQYGSAYFGWCSAVLAGRAGVNGAHHGARARRVLSAALAHTADPEQEPYASGFDRRTLSVTGHLNHRDFTWPAILKTFLAVSEDDPDLRTRLAAVDVPGVFRARPPSNWAAVWMCGEWLRMRAALSSTTAEQFDDWIGVFFAGREVGFDLGLGMYQERGLPNSYDLFTRAHFTDLLVQGYDGRHRDRLTAFLTTGLRRSLATQLSDGSMASGYRSAGQTWVLGAQIALFTGSRVLRLGSAEDQRAARLGAWRAFDSFARWQRPGTSSFSPVQNLLAPELRVGYERYTSDGHYAPLALGFLATAIEAGFGADEPPLTSRLDARSPQVLAERVPSNRGTLHGGRVSVAVQAEADDTYDASGVVDLTFGAGRWLHFVTAARHLSGGPWLVPGLAVRDRPGSSVATSLAGLPHRLLSPLVEQDGGLSFVSAVAVAVASSGEVETEYRHDLTVSLTDDGIEVVEATPGRSGSVSLLIPYLRDLGAGETTRVELLATGARFTLGAEWVRFAVAGRLDRAVDLPYGYESRRGLCGLVRIDLADPVDTLLWSVSSS